MLELLGAWVYSFPFQTMEAWRTVAVLVTHSAPTPTDCVLAAHLWFELKSSQVSQSS